MESGRASRGPGASRAHVLLEASGESPHSKPPAPLAGRVHVRQGVEESGRSPSRGIPDPSARRLRRAEARRSASSPPPPGGDSSRPVSRPMDRGMGEHVLAVAARAARRHRCRGFRRGPTSPVGLPTGRPLPETRLPRTHRHRDVARFSHRHGKESADLVAGPGADQRSRRVQSTDAFVFAVSPLAVPLHLLDARRSSRGAKALREASAARRAPLEPRFSVLTFLPCAAARP